VVTARGDKESQRKSFSLGANDFIVKPFEEESLLKSIVNQLHYVQNIKDKAALYSAQDVHLNSERIISRFLQIVSEEFHNSDISIGDICNEIHISARQLERKTKFFLSRTPKEYLNDYRLVMAQKLIRDGVRLKRVVGMCGFSSQSYFTKCYKVKFGVVPSKDKIV
jgi:AraC-like DNA-binding protein